MSLEEPNYEELGRQLSQYCQNYFVPLEHFFEIVEDPKVAPMIRGKGTEYHGFLQLQRLLDPRVWGVQKLSLNPQPNKPDEDMTVTHLATAKKLIIESKSTVRGSFRTGTGRTKQQKPHFKVKCHRSRSNIKLSTSSNDRYKSTDFDLILTNVSNAVFQEGSGSSALELLKDPKILEMLFEHYRVQDEATLIKAVYSDWRFAIPSEIADDKGFIPRTPLVFLRDDPHWYPLSLIESKIGSLVEAIRESNKRADS